VSVDDQLARLLRGTEEVIEVEELRKKLLGQRPLIVKLGADPSAPDLHLGHAVVLRKLRQFQDLGHEVVFLIGDFTGRVGDPTGRDKTRPQLTEEDVRKNAATYERQVFRILDASRTRIAFNSHWLASLTFQDVIRLAASETVARMLERDDFKARFKAERPIHLHEFFYPLMQGRDSVALRADVELGGVDQKFNLMMARDLMRQEGLEPEVAMLMPLLVGLDGERKMSKSLGNHIALDDPPEAMFGKIMSIPDHLISPYMKIATSIPEAEIRRWEESMAAGANPRDAKEALGVAVTADFWGEEAAHKAADGFRRVFKEKAAPEDMPRLTVAEDEKITDLLVRTGLVPSTSEARRLVAQGAVSLEGRALKDIREIVPKGAEGVLRIGRRRFVRLAGGPEGRAAPEPDGL